MNWLKSKKIILTHDSNFHADDVFSVATLSLILAGRIKIIRTRDQSKFPQADYILDVGQEYDPKSNKFDHHMEKGIDPRSNGIPYATFGLVWKEFGEKLCGSRAAADIVDKRLVQGLDAIDNNFNLTKDLIEGVRPYSVSEYVYSVNKICNGKDRSRAFEKLVIFASDLLKTEIKFAQELVLGELAIKKAYESAEDKRIIILDQNYFGLDILSDYPEPLYSIKPSVESDVWKIHTVTDKQDKSKNRLSLPVAWGAKTNEALAKITGVSDALYSDHRLFMATAKSKEGAIKMAQLAIELGSKN